MLNKREVAMEYAVLNGYSSGLNEVIDMIKENETISIPELLNKISSELIISEKRIQEIQTAVDKTK